MVSEPLLYHVEYFFFIFIFPHLHPNTCFHGYSQFQHHSFSKCQTWQENLSTVVFPIPSSSHTLWSRRPHRWNLSVSGLVPSFYWEGCSAHFQFGIHPLDQTWSDALILAYILAHRRCSCSCCRTHHISWCVVLSKANLYVTLQS